eukprot:6115087-Amphidinium_carterae.1
METEQRACIRWRTSHCGYMEWTTPERLINEYACVVVPVLKPPLVRYAPEPERWKMWMPILIPVIACRSEQNSLAVARAERHPRALAQAHLPALRLGWDFDEVQGGFVNLK